MAGSGKYQIYVDGILKDTKIRAQLQALQNMVDKGSVGKSTMTGASGRQKQAIAEVGKAAGKAQKQTKGLFGSVKSLGSGLGDITKKVAAFGAVTSAMQLASQGAKSVVQNVVDLDSALREYKKVSDLSGKSLEEWTDKAYEAGQKTAKTGESIKDA